MIDIENQVFQTIADAFRAEYPNGFISAEYVSKPSEFPAVFVMEMDNSVFLPGRDSADIENFANVMYQIDAYSNKNMGKKAECKRIIALIDKQFARLGFTRMFLNPIPNMDNATIYRITARYRAVVSKDNMIYRR